MITEDEEFEKSLTNLLIGEPVVFDNKGNMVKLCDIPPAYRIEYIECKDFTFEELKKAFEDLSSYEQKKSGRERLWLA